MSTLTIVARREINKMKTLKAMSIALLMLGSIMVLPACTVVKVHEHEYKHNGPPPHAPAHGYRHKHRGHTLEYNYDLGVYVVVGLVAHYFIDGIYYKKTEHGWYSSHDIDKGWHEYTKDVLPGKLNKKYGHKKGHEKKDKRENDKHRKGNDRRGKDKHDDDD